MLSLPLPFCSFSVSPLFVSRLGGTASRFTHVVRSTHLEPVSIKSSVLAYCFKRTALKATFSSLLINPLCLLIQVSVCAIQDAPAKSISTLVPRGILSLFQRLEKDEDRSCSSSRAAGMDECVTFGNSNVNFSGKQADMRRCTDTHGRLRKCEYL